MLVAVTQNGLNLLGISPYAFKMIIGAIILVAITLSSDGLGALIVVAGAGAAEAVDVDADLSSQRSRLGRRFSTRGRRVCSALLARRHRRLQR